MGTTLDEEERSKRASLMHEMHQTRSMLGLHLCTGVSLVSAVIGSFQLVVILHFLFTSGEIEN